MMKTVATLVAGVFFFSSVNGMGQWSIVSTAQAKSFDLEDEDEDEDFEDEAPAKTDRKTTSGAEEDDIDAIMEDEPSDGAVKKTAPADDLDKDTEEEDSGDDKTIAVFYFFADSTAEKKAYDIARTVGSYLAELSNYRFFESEARTFNDFSFDKLSGDLDKAKTYLDDGKKLLEDGEAEDAIGKFNAGLDLLEKRLDVLYDYKTLAKLLFYTGAAWKLIEEDDKAQDLFKRLLALEPDYEADEGIDEDTRDFFDKLKSKMMMMPLGDLKVTSEPAGATVYVDGRIAGMTPMTAEGLVVGKHYWRIHKSGYRDAGGIATVRDGGKEKVDETLAAGDGADAVAKFEKAAAAEFGGAAMMNQAVTVGKAAKVDRLLAVHAAVEQADEGTIVKIQLRLLNIPKTGYKEENVSFSLPSSGDLTRAEDLRHSLDNLFTDEFGFNPVSSIVSGSLSLDREKDGDSVVTKWWFWTIIGSVVAGGTIGCLLGIPGSPIYLGGKSSTGATMTVEFTP